MVRITHCCLTREYYIRIVKAAASAAAFVLNTIGNVLSQPMRSVLFFVMWFIFSSAWSQSYGELNSVRKTVPDTVWIIGGKHALGPAYKRYKLDFSLDGRQTLIGTQRARLGGLRVGVEYRRVNRFGLGLYGLGQGVELNSLPQIDTAITWAKVSLRYQSLFYERVLFFSRKLEWSITAHYGRGTVTGKYLRSGSTSEEVLPRQHLRVLELSSVGYYNFTYWLSIGAGVGYRYMYGLTDEIQDVYESPIALLRVRIKLGKLVKSIWDKDTRNLY
jgi:hypothetical protein